MSSLIWNNAEPQPWTEFAAGPPRVTCTHKCTATLFEHEDDVLSICSHEGLLCSGSSDETIKLWDHMTGRRIATLAGHQDAVSALCTHEGLLCSGSWDASIKLWETTEVPSPN